MKKNNITIFLKKLIVFVILFIKKVLKDDVLALAAQLAYYLILAFIPFLMFLMTLIGFSNLNSDEVIKLLSNVMPRASFELIENTVVQIINVQQKGILWISIALAIWVSSSGFSAVIRGLNKAYGVKETRSYIRLKLASIAYTLLLAITIIATLFLFVFGDLIADVIVKAVDNSAIIIFLWNIIRYLVVVCMMVLVFAFLYNVTPCKRLGWGEVLPGAALTTLGWIITSYLFAFYVNNFSNYSRLYGSLGAVFILMTWLFISSVILLLGGEVNAILANDPIKSDI